MVVYETQKNVPKKANKQREVIFQKEEWCVEAVLEQIKLYLHISERFSEGHVLFVSYNYLE